MQSRSTIIMAVLSLGVLAVTAPVHGQEKGSPKGSMMHEGSMKDGKITAKETASGAIKVGNTICPISKEKVGGMGEVVEHTYNGKTYNFCCKMCLTDFKKDPEKYVAMINASLADQMGDDMDDVDDMDDEMEDLDEYEIDDEDHAEHDHDAE